MVVVCELYIISRKKSTLAIILLSMTVYMLTCEKSSACGVKIAALEALPCRAHNRNESAPKSAACSCSRTDLHRRVSRKPDINQNDQSGVALSKTICISYES